MYGAIAFLGPDRVNWPLDSKFVKAWELLESCIPPGFVPPRSEQRIGAQWNDMPGRTKEEVVAVYDRAIASCAT